ncbi:hypothetical protein IJF81_03055, partial [bacterium]|nr:hypothetical protein [bacterium]
RRKDVDFPVIAEYYIENSWLLIKVKPRSNIYQYTGKDFNIDTAISTTIEKQVKEVQEKVSDLLNFSHDDYSKEEILKNRLFELLKLYTNTPEEIQAVLDNQEEMIEEMSQQIKDLCNLNDSQKGDVHDDIQNIVEKYLSIIWKDKEIFIKDREAYPIKLNATDDEASRVEQVAGFAQPLQTKAVFFDNKKMLYKSKKCDNIELKWKRKNRKYFSESFLVNISVNSRGVCILKFREYVVQEDIENVLSKIITV